VASAARQGPSPSTRPRELAVDLHPLEIAARECMAIARETNNIWVAMGAQDCAIAIRKTPGWCVYLAPWTYFTLKHELRAKRLVRLLKSVHMEMRACITRWDDDARAWRHCLCATWNPSRDPKIERALAQLKIALWLSRQANADRATIGERVKEAREALE